MHAEVQDERDLARTAAEVRQRLRAVSRKRKLRGLHLDEDLALDDQVCSATDDALAVHDEADVDFGRDLHAASPQLCRKGPHVGLLDEPYTEPLANGEGGIKYGPGNKVRFQAWLGE